MRNIYFIAFASLLLTSCFGGGSTESKDDKKQSVVQTAPPADHLANYTPIAGVEVDYCHGDLDVQVLTCEKNGNTAIITLLLTNYGEDELFEFWGSEHSAGSGTVAYDDAGYINKKGISVGFANHKLSTGEFTNYLPKEIPVRFKVVIPNLNPQASKILRLDLSLNSGGAMNFDYLKPIAIKNILFTKG